MASTPLYKLYKLSLSCSVDQRAMGYLLVISNDDECELCVCVKDAPAGQRRALMDSNSISEYDVWCVTKPSSSTHPKRAKLAQKK